MKLLIIEDNEPLAKLFAKQATNHGHCVELAYDFIDAVAVLKTGQFDLILCDIDLGTGHNHGPKALLQSELHGAKILFMTAVDEYAEAIQPLIDLGYDVECLRKPVNLSRFLEILRL